MLFMKVRGSGAQAERRASACRRSMRGVLVRLGGAVLTLGAFVSLSGCGGRVDRALQGRWFGDSVENFDPGDVAAATGWAKGASFEFSSGTLTVAIPAEDPRKGHYEVESAHEGDVVVAVRDDRGAVNRTHLTLDGDRFLKWHVDERRSIVMRRED
jgi:hypothetical protein